MAIKVGFVSLGCPKNLVNTEIMLSILASEGFELVAEDIDADVVVINTCSFIESAKQEAIDNILDIAWLKKHHNLKGIVVAGCLTQRYQEELFKEMPEIDAIIGTGSLEDVGEAVRHAYNKQQYHSCRDVNVLKLGGERVVTTPEYYAYIQISEGCDNHCSYCVIPQLRGSFRSRPMADIIEEAEELAALGVKELIVVAQDTTRYGEDLFGVSALDSLLTELSAINGIEWIRLLYCYPDRITDELIEVIATNPKVVKYIDMPIQHIDDRILNMMNRRDTEESIRTVIKKLRERVPGIVLRSTVIVGFPGETEQEFNKLYNFIKETAFERFGVFSYSREEGTASYDFPNQISTKQKTARQDKIMSLQHRIHNDFNNTFVGKPLRVLCEGYDMVSECYYGRSYADAPEIDGKVYFDSHRRLREGEMVDVMITELLDYDLYGKTIT